jgi:hypothetical protein
MKKDRTSDESTGTMGPVTCTPGTDAPPVAPTKSAQPADHGFYPTYSDLKRKIITSVFGDPAQTPPKPKS